MCPFSPHLKHVCLDFHELSPPSPVWANIAPSSLVTPASCRRLFHPAGGTYAFRMRSTASGLSGYVLVPVTKFSFMPRLRSLYFAPFAPLSMRAARNFSRTAFFPSFICSLVALLMSVPSASISRLSMLGKWVIEPAPPYSSITSSIAMKSSW